MIEVQRQTLAARGAAVQPAKLTQQGSAGGPGVGRVPADTVDERLKHRLWLTACCLALVVLAFVDRPGNILADTKLDLAVNPVGFLDRALHLWDPAQFGQLQNQAVGYFFPAGPFFVLGKLMALPPWVVQRLWMTAIMLAAFLGVVRLAGRFGIGTTGTRIAAGFAYALAPRALSLVGVISGEFLPAAMLPWILIPLVRAVREGSEMSTGRRIRAAAQSAAAVALCSGMNAASVLAMLIPPVIFLLTAPRPAPRWRIFAWWVPAVVLACWSWLYPLLLLGKYGVSSLPYTESAAITTSVTSLVNSLRGTEDWVTYLVVNGRPWWPVGFSISNEALPTILTGIIAGLGLAGLAWRRMPERRFLIVSVLAGIFIVSTGYVSGLGSPLAGPLTHLINGPLSPLRNLRKFDPMIRLPVALGLAHLLASIRIPRISKAVSLVAATAVAMLATPALVGGMSQAGDFASLPSYWTSAADWLNVHAGNQAVLEEPGARFGEYVWGRPMDDVLQPLFNGDWASRQLNTVGSVGVTRLLDAIDQRMAAGDGSAGLTQVLAWMGVKYIVVRNDLLRSDLREAWPARIHQALQESPGIVKVAQFGSIPIGSEFPGDVVRNLDVPYPPVEIYQVTGAAPAVTVQPSAGTLRVYGGPEALLTLADEHLLNNRPVLLNADDPGLPARMSIVTDSLRRRIRNFGEIRVDYSQTLTATDPASTFEAVGDYLEPGWVRYLSVARYAGISNVTASSSVADISAISSQSATGRPPFGAVDGDLRTMWESGGIDGPVGQWIKIEFDHSVDPGTIDVAFADNRAIGPPVTQVAVRTATGQLTESVRDTGNFQSLRVPAGGSTWLRIRITRTEPGPTVGRQAGIAEISVPGVVASRTIVAPYVTTPGGGDPTMVVLSKAEPQPSGCMLAGPRWICSPALVRPTEEQYGFDHSFFFADPATATLSGSALLTNPSLIERYSWPGTGQPRVTAWSTYTTDPQDQAASAFDGNPATTWIARGASRSATLSIRWTRRKVVREVTVIRPLGASGPAQVLLRGSGGQVRGGLLLGPTARLRFAPMRTNRLNLKFTPSALPLQITDVVIPGIQQLRSGGSSRFMLPCGFGPEVELDGRMVPTRVWGTFADLLDRLPLAFSACSAVRVVAGQNRIVEPGSDTFDVQTVVVNRAGSRAQLAGSASSGESVTAPSSGDSVTTTRWTAATRVLQVAAPERSYLVVNENFNQGWQATAGGKTLQPVRLDGWKQGWLLPAGTRGVVTLTYLPDALYRVNLFGGLGALVVVLVVAWVPMRRRRVMLPAWPAAAREPHSPRPRPGKFRLGARPALAAAGIVVASFFGFWIAGYPGALLLSASAVLFSVAIAFRRTSRIWRVIAGPWVAPGLLLVAAISGALGVRLLQAGDSGSAVTWLWDTGPQLLCVVVVGRMCASVVMPPSAQDSVPDRHPLTDSGQAARTDGND